MTTPEGYILLPKLQGHRKQIWDCLATPVTQKERPKTYKEICKACPNIPPPSIRRNLSEMKRDRYLVHATPMKQNYMEFGGERHRLRASPYKGKWRRNV
jgi:hypothetical protein